MALAIILVLLSIVSVTRPWMEVNQKAADAIGWPSQLTRGLTYGVDFVGGSRIMLRLEASHVTIELRGENIENSSQSIYDALTENLSTTVKEVGYDRRTHEVMFEIGQPVTENFIVGIVDNYGELKKIEEKVSSDAREEVMNLLSLRVDPYGTLGAVFKPVGANFVLYEIAGLAPEQAEVLLGRQGRLEIFLENDLILTGGDIHRVGSTRVEPIDGGYKYHVPFTLTGDGADRFRSAVSGKANYPGVIYLDRPSDAILVFDSQILNELPATISGYAPGGPELNYDSDARMFYVSSYTSSEGTTIPGYYLFGVLAVGTSGDSLSQETLRFLTDQSGIKTRVLLLGEFTNFSENVREGIAAIYPNITNISRKKDESTTKWIMRACGWQSAPTISPELASGTSAGRNLEITGTRSSSKDASTEANNLRVILSQRLPVRISYEGETAIDPRLGREFMQQVILAGLVALIAIGILIYLRYRHVKISAAIMGTMIFELIITLGVASIIPYNFDLPELGGLIIVIGTGVDQQIIITDELLRGGAPQTKRVSTSGRIGRAFRIIWGSAFTTLAAMTSLALLGFGMMRGFALITILGLVVAVLVTRPAYARIASAIVTGETTNNKQLSSKIPQKE